MNQNKTLKEQIEDAFNYRGNVTIFLKNGEQTVGFLYNREYTNPHLEKDQFISLFLESGEDKTYNLNEVEAVALTGEDCAAGKSYEEWMAKHQKKAS